MLSVNSASLSRSGQKEVFFYREESTELEGSGVGKWDERVRAGKVDQRTFYPVLVVAVGLSAASRGLQFRGLDEGKKLKSG